MFNIKTITVSTLALAAVATTIPANAAIPKADRVETRVRVVDLQTEDGLNRVYDQLLRQAEKECAPVRRTILSERQIAEACTADLLNDFIVDIGNEKLTRIHQEKTAG